MTGSGYRIAIASGKGGTGKTTLAVNLFHFMAASSGVPVTLVDCDVEEPNDLLFFPEAALVRTSQVLQSIPVISAAKCTYCGQCAEYCEFNAIVVIPPVAFAEVNKNLCHSCGACLVACTEDAISERPEPIGQYSLYSISDNGFLAEGRLRIGSAMQTMLIRELGKEVPAHGGIYLCDAPPGTSCPVVEVISGADYVILVTEPTPFGLYDLRLMVDLVREINLPFGVVINKAGLGDRKVHSFLQQERIDLLGEIPFSREYAASYARGELFENIPADVTASYRNLAHQIEQKTSIHEGDYHP